LWYEGIAYDINAARGSVQNIEGIPQWIKDVYKTVWEVPMKPQMDMSRDRAIFVCQGQSFNWHIPKPTQQIVEAGWMYAWQLGLKTGMYYLRMLPATDAVQITSLARQNTVRRTLERSNSCQASGTPLTLSATTQPEEAEVCRMEPGCKNCGA
jgi:ribonucleotide reductase alpha subunit